MNKIIKNTVALLGNFDSVQEIRRKINTEKSKLTLMELNLWKGIQVIYFLTTI